MNKMNPKELSYFYHEEDVPKWLDTDPDESEIKYDERNKKSIPYSIMKAKLDRLCPESWDIRNFHVTFFFTNDRRQWVSGHIDLVVSYAYLLEDGTVRKVERTLAGAATFCTDDYAPNTHWAATVKSLAVCNAAQPLGKQFGWNLNPEEGGEKDQDFFTNPITELKNKQATRNGRTSSLMQPDMEIRKKYAQAVCTSDFAEMTRLASIYNFNEK